MIDCNNFLAYCYIWRFDFVGLCGLLSSVNLRLRCLMFIVLTCRLIRNWKDENRRKLELSWFSSNLAVWFFIDFEIRECWLLKAGFFQLWNCPHCFSLFIFKIFSFYFGLLVEILLISPKIPKFQHSAFFLGKISGKPGSYLYFSLLDAIDKFCTCNHMGAGLRIENSRFVQKCWSF